MAYFIAENGDYLLAEDGSYLLLDELQPRRILTVQALGEVEELESAEWCGQFSDIEDPDGDDQHVGLSVIEAFLLHTYETTTPTLIRNTQDVLNANDVTVHDSGLIVWNLRPSDNEAVTQSTLNRTERHRAVFEWAYEAAATTTPAADPLAVTLDDETVTVSHTAHGLAVGDTIVITSSDDVGGLKMRGVWIVKTVPDADTFTFEHECAATSTVAAGGGTVTYLENPHVGKHTLDWTVRRTDKRC